LITKIIKYYAAVLLVSLLFPVIADARIEYTLFPRLSIEGRYSDNYYNMERKEDKKDAFLITVSPGILLSLITKDITLDIDYNLNSTGYFIEDEKKRFEYFNQRGSGIFRANLLRNFSILLQDEILKNENVSLIDVNLARVERRVKYIRNISGGELIYRYGDGSEVATGYTFTILDYYNSIVDDNKRHDFNGRLRHSFNIRNIGEVNYRHSIGDYRRLNDPGQISRDDLYEDEVKGRFTHYFTPRFSSGVNYGYLETHYDGLTSDYHVHDAAVESLYDINQYLKVDGRVGLFLRELYGRDSWDKGLIYRAGIAYNHRVLIGMVAYEGGYSSSYTSPERLEFSNYWRVSGDITYHMIRDILMLIGRGSYGVNRYPDSPDSRRDHIWNGGGGINYRIVDWLLLSLDYNHMARNSNISGLHYVENTYLARITISYRYSTIERERVLRREGERDDRDGRETERGIGEERNAE
jgi:hypothetical protein